MREYQPIGIVPAPAAIEIHEESLRDINQYRNIYFI